MSEIDLSERFPEMKPVRSAPWLGQFNGCGFSMYGKRGSDAESGTYIATQCFSVLWIPIFALNSYRVAKADGGGWYFLGRVPLSGFAKLVNILVFAGALSLGGQLGWDAYQARPEVHASRRMDRASDLVESNKLGEAARVYREVGAGDTTQAAPARRALLGLIRERIANAPAAQAVAVVEDAMALQKRFPSRELEGVRGEVVTVARATSDADAAMRLLDLVTKVGEPFEGELALRRKLLVQLVKSEPDNVTRRSALAQLCELADELDRCRELLEPYRAKLGDSEGARILGQLDARDGKFDEALALLGPYVAPRLDRLRAAQREHERAWSAAWEAEVAKLNNGDGPADFYRDWKRASDARKQDVVDAHVGKILERDWKLAGKTAAFREATTVVPAAIDLGIVHLRRAQSLSDPEQRKAALLEAEQTFLATRAVTGESNEYRIFLGQVYYWLGREKEATALFDQLLESNARSTDILLQLCNVMRELGSFKDACTYAEEAYAKAKDPKVRMRIAYLRAMTTSDTDDSIVWFERSDKSLPYVRAALSYALGERAHEAGRFTEAARQYRTALDAYTALPPDSANMHNAAGVCMQILSIEFDRAILDRAVGLIEKSTAAKPGSALGMIALARVYWTRALVDAMEGRIDLKAARLRPHGALLPFLYNAPEGREAVQASLLESRDVRRARSLCDQARVIAPRSANIVQTAVEIDGRLQDIARLGRVLEAIKSVAPDTGLARAAALARYTREGIAESRDSMKNEIERLRRVLGSLPGDVSAETRAVAITQLARQLIAGQTVGLAADPAEVGRLVKQAHELAPSVSTDTMLVAAEIYAAHLLLIASQPAYRASAKRLGPALPCDAQVALALFRPGAVKDAASKLPEVRRACDRILAQAEVWPTGVLVNEWAVVSALRPDEARKIASRLKAEQRHALRTEIYRRLYPFSPTTAADCYLWYEMVGNKKAAAAVIAAIRRAGTPAPILD